MGSTIRIVPEPVVERSDPQFTRDGIERIGDRDVVREVGGLGFREHLPRCHIGERLREPRDHRSALRLAFPRRDGSGWKVRAVTLDAREHG
jgi:hypothetical protein